MKIFQPVPRFRATLFPLVSAVFLSAGFSLCAAQEPAPDTGNPPAAAPAAQEKISPRDRDFLIEAAKGGEKEVSLSAAMRPKLMDSSAREFAQTMVIDHGKANEELKALAEKKGVTLPGPDEKIAAKWSKKMKDVDADYLKEMADDHKKTIKLFERGAASSDQEIASFAYKMLPTLRRHLEQVQMIEDGRAH